MEVAAGPVTQGPQEALRLPPRGGLDCCKPLLTLPECDTPKISSHRGGGRIRREVPRYKRQHGASQGAHPPRLRCPPLSPHRPPIKALSSEP